MKNRSMNGIVALLAAGALVLTAGCGGDNRGSSDETFEITTATYFGPNSFHQQAMDWWAGEVEERTDGRVTFRHMTSGSLLEAANTLEGVGAGRADMGQVADAYYPDELPLANASGAVPFMLTSPFGLAATHASLFENDEAFRAEYEDQNVVVPFFLPTTPSLIGIEGSAEGLDDFAGMSIRASGGNIPLVEALGASPVVLAAGETYESLERGLIDGYTGFQMDSISDFGVYEVSDNIYYGGYLPNSVVAQVMNRDLWESFPEDIQEVITEVSNEVLEGTMELMENHETAVCDTLIEADMQPQLLSDEDSAEWEDRVGDAPRELWIADAEGAADVDDLEAWFDSYVDLIQEMDEEYPFTTGAIACAER